MSEPRIGLAWGDHPWELPPPRTRPLLSAGAVLRNLQHALAQFAAEVRPWNGGHQPATAQLDEHLAGLDVVVCDAYSHSFPFLERRAAAGQEWRALILAHGNMPKAGDPLFTRRPELVRPGDGILFTSAADHAIWGRLVARSSLVERVAPLPVDSTLFHPSPVPTDVSIRTRFGLPDDVPLLLYVGRYNIQKNLHGLLDLLAEVRQSRPDVHLACVGGPDDIWLAEFRVANTGYLSYLKSRADHLGVADAFHLLGPAFGEDLAALYRNAAIVVNLGFYHRENFGLSQAEAQACGTPVVCSAWGGFRDVVDHGVTGMLVDATMTTHGIRVNWADAATAIVDLLENDATRQAMGRAAAARASTEFSIATFADRLASAVNAVAATPPFDGPAFEASPLARRYLAHATAHGWTDPDDDGWEPPMYQGGDYEIYEKLLGPYASTTATDAGPASVDPDAVPFPVSPWHLDHTRQLLEDQDPVWPQRRFVLSPDWLVVAAIDGRSSVAALAATTRTPLPDVQRVVAHLHREGLVLFREVVDHRRPTRQPSEEQSLPRYDDIADWYAEFTRDWGREPVALLPDDLAGQRILDLGCGLGHGARSLANSGARVTAVDLSPAMIVEARRTHAGSSNDVQYLVGDATTTDWWDGQPFDGVLSNMSLMDIDDLDAALATAATVLKPGGWLSLSIFHPCYPGGPEGSASGLPSWPPDRGYASDGLWMTAGEGIRGRVGANHRMLSTYLNALLHAGFRIEELAEPPATIPLFLLVRSLRSHETTTT